jgi:hypothetical protein
MSNKQKLLVNGLILIAFILSACGKTTTPTPAASQTTVASPTSAVVNKFPPFHAKGYEQQTNETASTKYIIVDIQLGGIEVEDYYREYASQDPIIQQAINYYDSGARIVNIYQFTRVELGNDGWQVIYGGTDNIICQGDDIVLTSEISNDESTAYEAQIRYILADIQLGNVEEYYRQYTDQPAVAEAIRRWDAGIRVVNIDQFERRIINYAGWKIIYYGTDTVINGMNVVLSSDQVENPTQSGNADQCAQFNLTPEQCANNGQHKYTYTRTVTLQPGQCCGCGPDVNDTIGRNLIFTFPLPADFKLLTTVVPCVNSFNGNTVTYACDSHDVNDQFYGTTIFTNKGVIIDYEQKRVENGAVVTVCQVHEEYILSP